MAYKKQAHRACGSIELLLDLFRQSRAVSKEKIVIKAVIDRSNISSGPEFQFFGKRLGRRNRTIRPANRAPRKDALQASLQPHAVFSARTQVAIKIAGDRKSTRLNSSHQIISYAVFCLKKKKKE